MSVRLFVALFVISATACSNAGSPINISSGASSTASVDASEHRHWRLVRTFKAVRGVWHYVYMPPAHWHDLGEYRQAIKDLCDPKGFCAVEFWKDISMVPDAFGTSTKKALAQIPVIASYKVDGTIQVGWFCEHLQPKPAPCPPAK